MNKLAWERCEPIIEPVPPPDGWHKPTCSFASHLWELAVEDGSVAITCTDPCDARLFDPSKPTAICLVDWQSEDLYGEFRVVVTYVSDSIPSTPAGPAEYGFYLEVRPRENT